MDTQNTQMQNNNMQELLEKAKQEHRENVGPKGYVPPIPAGVKPRALTEL